MNKRYYPILSFIILSWNITAMELPQTDIEHEGGN